VEAENGNSAVRALMVPVLIGQPTASLIALDFVNFV
jgi:hypothetical protein